ncbi:MAG: hydrogenase maturation nickel metallochaperone HypA [Oscillospiraceae bacterium]|nr:hydrogenase maturation nickel metallochaperone HypA [Oscillospiraceae bacterium]
MEPMHEIGILRQLVRTVEAFAAENGVSDIREVVVDCGELSLVIPEYLEELYPVAAKGSLLQDAKLTIRMVPGLAECDDCDEIFNVIEHKGYCPNCGSFEKTVLSGREFSVREIVVPDEGALARGASGQPDP